MRLDKALNDCNYSQVLWLALAAQMSLPAVEGHIPDVRAVFSPDDYPDSLLVAEKSGQVYTRTTVRPDGTVQGCVAEITSTDPKLDAYTCGIIVRRAKFRPATWIDGTRAYGVIRVPVTWLMTDPPSREESLRQTLPDIDLLVDRLPKGARSIESVSLELATDEKGHPVTCAEVPPTDNIDRKRHFSGLLAIACQQAMTNLTLRPAVDDSGKPVRSVQGASVYFRAKQ